MPVMNMSWNWTWAWSESSNGNSASMQVNMGAGLAVALVSLSSANGDGLRSGGVSQYTNIPAGGGAAQTHTLSWNSNYGYQPIAYDPQMTSVTAMLEVGDSQGATLALSVWLWN